jgi:1-acyl-sn-glycerol-3-phosphate acyltransferase
MIVLRSAVFNTYFIILTAILSPMAMFVRLIAPSRTLMIPVLWARCLLAGLRVICGIRVAVSGREYLPQAGPALIASQHQSAFDTVVWLTLVPRCSYVVKRELARIPVFGNTLRPAGMIVVDRAAGPSALRHLVREAERAAGEDRQMVIFPEGTRGEPGRPLPLQPGVAAMASRTGLAVIPVVTDSGLLWGRRAFRKRAGTIHLRLLQPIPPTLGRDALMLRLNAAFRTPVVDNSVS